MNNNSSNNRKTSKRYDHSEKTEIGLAAETSKKNPETKEIML